MTAQPDLLLCIGSIHTNFAPQNRPQHHAITIHSISGIHASCDIPYVLCMLPLPARLLVLCMMCKTACAVPSVHAAPSVPALSAGPDA